ncbi:class E sortase [Gryllotalpicola protaetiae]|uniref:Class E sortase n=1 Tax=Gryllotalpicola protaetiae TaxID=2419771 RepID=A0A387BND1_9MICO|nr:class E sortase [Gryllotalpicola protaetiae]
MSFLGIAGELLLTAGVLVLLFIAWQNVFNSWVLNGQQNGAASQLGKQWLENSAPAPSSSPGASGGSGQASVGPDAAIPVASEPANAQPIAVIYVPRFGTDWKRTIREGTGDDVLNSPRAGVGHYAKTGMPGAVGNFAVAAHDTGYGSTFLHVQNLRLGDKVYVQTKDGFYTYAFRNYQYVQPTDVAVLDPVPSQGGAQASDRILTMTTCNPPYHTVERLISYSVLESFSTTPPAAIASDVG